MQANHAIVKNQNNNAFVFLDIKETCNAMS